MSGLLLGIVLSVCTCWLHNMVTLPLLLLLREEGGQRVLKKPQMHYFSMKQ